MGLKLLTWIAALWGMEKLSDEGIEIELGKNKMNKVERRLKKNE